MLTKDDFIRHILGEAPRSKAVAATKDTGHIEGFDFADDAPDLEEIGDTRFVTPLLQAGFGDGRSIPRATVIRSSDAVAKYIPDEVRYWPKTPTRPHHTLLIEANLTHRELLAIPAFKSRQLAHLDIAEDAVARLVAEALEGFQRGADGLDASALKGPKHETLCVVSIIDEREGHAGRLACFGTFNAKSDGFETFFLTEHARAWDRADARKRLGLIYDRQFKKLGEASWQEAFTTTDERKQAEKLLEVCTRTSVAEKDLQESILDLLDTIARGFGLRKKADAERYLRAFPLPGEHDIGIDSEEREGKHGGINPFSGVTLRDDQSRLLGYIVYPLKTKDQAEKLRQHLEKHNRFHNVLVVYPDANQASIELWQGREQLTGKLRKSQSHKDAADVVNLLSRFFVVSKAKVRNPAELAQELAYRARYLRRLALRQLQSEAESGQLRKLYTEFTKALVHDLSEPEFADAFAQTLTYSLLTARWVLDAQGETSADRFSRKEAMKKLSIGSRFLSEMFNAVLAMKLEDRGRLLWLVDDIADLLDRIDIQAVFKPDGTDLTNDPIIHFYEPFLAAYDPRIRMQRGAFYTPKPVVSYIVRSVHELLQSEFVLEDGLADTTTWGEMLKKHPEMKLPLLSEEPGETRTISPDEPFVQILDPATGTGTFLVEVIDVIHRTLAAKWQAQRLTEAQQLAAWNHYVPQHLLPRLYAFELMMAPYAIAHMKVGLKLAETGYHFGREERARIYLTNALEPWVKQLPLIGFKALADEAAAVNQIKRHKRFTVIVGNPPYSGISSNMSKSICALVDPYKSINGAPLGERKIWTQDDYKKFLRFGQLEISSAGCGILGFITNHGFISEPTSRGMRHSLLTTFPQVSVLDLHGSLKKRETCPDGSPDRNVFDIEPGVAISFLRRVGRTPSFVSHGELWGSRESKYTFLTHCTHQSTNFNSVSPSHEFYLLVPQSANRKTEFAEWISITKVFESGSNGIQTSRDHVVYGFSKEECRLVIKEFRTPESLMPTHELREKYWPGKKVANYAPGDTRGWNFPVARQCLRQDDDWESRFKKALYRPFDLQTLFYADYMIDWPRTEVMSQMLRPNLSLCVGRAGSAADNQEWNIVFVSKSLVDMNLFYRGGNVNYPLRFGTKSGGIDFNRESHPNFKTSFLKKLSDALDLPQTCEFGLPAGLTPEDIFHYTYAVFHSPGYRSHYAEFLKIDFPRLPLTGNLELFRSLAQLGGELTALHLLEAPQLNQPITKFIGNHNAEVGRIAWVGNSVFIDAPACKKGTNQPPGKTGFSGVPEDVWNFHIGGYQVCEKWLKDRKGRKLSEDDIVHYQKIVVALAETIRLMDEIDNVIEEHGGWPGAFVTQASPS